VPEIELTQQKLMASLEPGVWRSGVELAQQFGVTRTSVWKAVQSAKRQGYPLEAGTKGYRLEADAPVGVEGISYFGSVGSTMDEAKRLARAGAAEFTTVLSERQTSGRGRRGRVWQSPSGAGLYLTMVLRPALPLGNLSLLPLLAGACLQRAIRVETGLEGVLKWSNDVLAQDGRKLAGVLLEAEIEDGTARFVLMGVGVNVRQQNFPAELNAAALEDFVECVHRRHLLERILEEFKAQYKRFLETPESALILWRSMNGTLGRAIRVLEPDGKTWDGTALEVTSAGGLQVKTQHGIKTVFAGDVSLRHLVNSAEEHL
jgi:BirA family transcriptional regulator, biotin operon repressor / biotin---[acetyl-CoA-carboxylase] ligase